MVRRLDDELAVAAVEAQAVRGRRRDQADRGQRGAHQGDEVRGALERRDVLEARGERHGQQEREQELHARQRDPELLQELGHLALGAFLLALHHSISSHT